MKTIETNVLETVTGGFTANPNPQPLTPEQRAANRINVTLPPNADELRLELRARLQAALLGNRVSGIFRRR
jgi:hypothetical protein